MATIAGGAKLDKAMADLAKRLHVKGTLRVGFLEGATYPDGKSVAMVAALANFGHGPTPPRPFFSNMVAAKNSEWAPALAALLEGGMPAADALAKLGEGIEGQLAQSIVDTMEPPLSPVTVMLRHMKAEDPSLEVTGATVGEAYRRVQAGDSPGDASTKPLVETGHMLQSIGSEVKP